MNQSFELTLTIVSRSASLATHRLCFPSRLWWCGRVVKVQCFQCFRGVFSWVRIPSPEPLTTSQQSTQLSLQPRSVNEYSDATLRAQAVMLQTHISCVAAHIPTLHKQMKVACLLGCMLQPCGLQIGPAHSQLLRSSCF